MQPLIAEIIRDLTEDDLANPPQKAVAKAPTIKRITERHHRLARCLADGMSPGEAAIACDYSASRISILQADPSFQNLVRFYKANVAERYFDTHARLASVANASLDELEHRLETAPEEITTSELMALTKMGADRTGHGPQTQHNVSGTINFGARLDAARQRLLNEDVIDAEVVDAKQE